MEKVTPIRLRTWTDAMLRALRRQGNEDMRNAAHEELERRGLMKSGKTERTSMWNGRR